MPEMDPLWMEKILANKKYRRLNLREDTLQDLLRQVQGEGVAPRQAEKAVREKLHHIVAPYLETVDYTAAAEALKAIPTDDRSALTDFSQSMLRSHTSTAERMVVLDEFYAFIATQLPQKEKIVIMDLACAANPFALPRMHLPNGVQFLAYDLNGARIALLNLFFEKSHLDAYAYHQDILIHVPQQPADAVFFFKEAHRFEQRQKGSTREFLQQLQTPLIFLSLPARNMTGRHDLRAKHIKLVAQAIEGLGWQSASQEFGEEILFCIRK